MSTPPRTSALRREEPLEALAFEQRGPEPVDGPAPSLLVQLGPDQPLPAETRAPSVRRGNRPQIGLACRFTAQS